MDARRRCRSFGLLGIEIGGVDIFQGYPPGMIGRRDTRPSNHFGGGGDVPWSRAGTTGIDDGRLLRGPRGGGALRTTTTMGDAPRPPPRSFPLGPANRHRRFPPRRPADGEADATMPMRRLRPATPRRRSRARGDGQRTVSRRGSMPPCPAPFRPSPLAGGRDTSEGATAATPAAREFLQAASLGPRSDLLPRRFRGLKGGRWPLPPWPR